MPKAAPAAKTASGAAVDVVSNEVAGQKWIKDKTSQVVSTEEKGFNKFIWDRRNEAIGSFSDTDFLIINTNYFCISEIAGDPAWTKLIDETAGQWGLITQAVNQGFKGGNMKDVVAANKTAFIKYSATWLLMLFELGIQYFIRGMLGNLTYSDTAYSGTNGPAVFTNQSFTNIVSEIVNRGLVVPKFVLDLFKLFHFYVQLTEPYLQGTTMIPPSYYYPWKNVRFYAEVYSNSNSLFHQLLSYSGEARIHAEKFSIPMEKFSVDMLEARKIALDSPDWLAYLSHCMIDVLGTAEYPMKALGDMYTNTTTSYTTRRYYFHADKDASFLHRAAMLMSNYDGTNNPYGLVNTVPPTINCFGLVHCSYLGTAFAEIPTTWTKILLFPAGVEGDQATHAKLTLSLTGGTSRTLSSSYCPALLNAKVFYGDAVTFASAKAWAERLFTSAVMGTVRCYGA